MSQCQFGQGAILQQHGGPIVDPSLQEADFSPRHVWESLKYQLSPFCNVISLAHGAYNTWDNTTIEFVKAEMQ